MAAGDLCSLTEVREHLQIDAAETEQDPVITSLITRVSKAITSDYKREFAKPDDNQHTRRFKVRPLRWGYAVDLTPYDLRVPTSVKLNPETASPQTLVADSDYVAEPVTGTEGVTRWLRLSPWLSMASTVATRFGSPYVDVAGTWGFGAVPDDVKEAAILAVIMHIRGEVQAFGGSLQPNSIGEGVNDAEALPPGVRGLLKPYERTLPIR